MGKAKTIYCPQCGHKALTYDGRATVNVASLCRKCRKRVVYIPSEDKTVIEPMPERKNSSGGFYW